MFDVERIHRKLTVATDDENEESLWIRDGASFGSEGSGLRRLRMLGRKEDLFDQSASIRLRHRQLSTDPAKKRKRRKDSTTGAPQARM